MIDDMQRIRADRSWQHPNIGGSADFDLAIVNSIVENDGACLSVKSEHRRTLFYQMLP